MTYNCADIMNVSHANVTAGFESILKHMYFGLFVVIGSNRFISLIIEHLLM